MCSLLSLTNWLPVTGFFRRQQLGANRSSLPVSLSLIVRSNRARDVNLSAISSSRRLSIEVAVSLMTVTICLESNATMSMRGSRRVPFHVATINLPVWSDFLCFFSSALQVEGVGASFPVYDWRSLAHLRARRALRDVDFDMVCVVVV